MTPRNDWKFHKRCRICSTQNTILSFFRVFLSKICLLSDFRAVIPGQSLYFVGRLWQRCVLMVGCLWNGMAACGIYGIHFLTSYFFKLFACRFVCSANTDRVSLLSANNFFLMLFSRIPGTTRSLSKLSCSVPKLHVLINAKQLNTNQMTHLVAGHAY